MTQPAVIAIHMQGTHARENVLKATKTAMYGTYAFHRYAVHLDLAQSRSHK